MSYQVVVKKWFDKKNGNTYHSVKLYSDNVFIDSEPFIYGYDDQYKVTTYNLLVKNGLLPKNDNVLKSGMPEGLYNFLMDLRDNKNKYLFIVSEVKKEGDL